MRSFRLLAVCAFAVLMLGSPALAQGGNLSDLHDALHLTPSQEDAWRSFQAATNDPEAGARRQNAEMMMPTLSAPRRVDLSIALMQADLETLERQGGALKTFYATLTPAQQTIFDRQTLPPPPQQGQ